MALKFTIVRSAELFFVQVWVIYDDIWWFGIVSVCSNPFESMKIDFQKVGVTNTRGS